MIKKKTGIHFCLAVLAVLAVLTVPAVPAAPPRDTALKKPSTPFDTDEILELKLTADIKAIRKDIKEENSNHLARLSYTDVQNREISLNVLIKTRGHSRKNPGVCDFPPLTIRFIESEAGNTIFRRQNTLKLVTHCKTKIKVFESYVLQEYLIYKLYNLLTDKSFRVRLARVTYVDSQGKIKPYTRYGFFIENDKKMAGRLNGKIFRNREGFGIINRTGDRVLHAVFQFMIGNTDWSAAHEHNVRLVAVDRGDLVFPVPYDFDLAGIIDAHYAKPPPNLAIESVRDRLYRGFCCPQEQLASVFADFNKKKEKICALYMNFPLLKSRYKKNIIRYLDRFYEIINNPRLARKHFIENCR
jgi:hypothetical protein